MGSDSVQYLSNEKLNSLKKEMKELKEEKIIGLAQRIDEARQMGDLSENAEYHAAREEMAWVQSRVKELEHIMTNAEVITGDDHSGVVRVGSVITVEVKNAVREYTIVGAQEADPTKGKISNESPLGTAFLGCKKGETVEVQVPSGTQTYKIKNVV